MEASFYLYYPGANALTEAQAACDLCHKLASRSVEEGGIQGYTATKYADPIKHPEREEYVVPFDVERAAIVDIPSEIQERLNARAKLTPAEVESGGWFADDSNDPASEIIERESTRNFPLIKSNES